MTIIETDIGKIDLDKGAIEIDNKWLTIAGLKDEIKNKIASDDFDVSSYTSALKALEKELKNYELVSFKAPKNVIESIKELSNEKDKSFDNMLLDALSEYLKMEGIEVSVPGGISKGKKKQKPEPEETEEEAKAEDEDEDEMEVEFEIDEAEVDFEEVESDEPDDEPGDDADEDAGEGEVVDETSCPRCGGKVPITSTKRPLTIKCPSCGKKGRLLS